mmetsp:Transcript_36217/g.116001  ORF Transcript_36217/g.116001 Transcript_36217/m.116001 type:complete len:207 (-) Transcript_36217:135-755(-)
MTVLATRSPSSSERSLKKARLASAEARRFSAWLSWKSASWTRSSRARREAMNFRASSSSPRSTAALAATWAASRSRARVVAKVRAESRAFFAASTAASQSSQSLATASTSFIVLLSTPSLASLASYSACAAAGDDATFPPMFAPRRNPRGPPKNPPTSAPVNMPFPGLRLFIASSASSSRIFRARSRRAKRSASSTPPVAKRRKGP